MSNVSSISSVRAPRQALQFLTEKWVHIVGGLAVALVLAICLLTLARVNSLSAKIGSLSKELSDAREDKELARTRYEGEIRELHEIKTKIDTQTAWYQQDIRDMFLSEMASKSIKSTKRER